jgi:hypothetical protein
VTDEQEGRAVFAANLADEGKGLAGVLVVEVARRLIGEDELGTVGERPSDSHALLLAGGKLVGKMSETMAETDPLQHFLGVGFVRATRAEAHPEHHVF